MEEKKKRGRKPGEPSKVISNLDFDKAVQVARLADRDGVLLQINKRPAGTYSIRLTESAAEFTLRHMNTAN